MSEDRLAKGQWQRARVEATHTSRDDLVKSVTLRLSSGSLTRCPAQRLRLLETCDADLAVDRVIEIRQNMAHRTLFLNID